MTLRLASTLHSFTRCLKWIFFASESLAQMCMHSAQPMVLELLCCLEQVYADNVLSHDVSSICGFNRRVL